MWWVGRPENRTEKMSRGSSQGAQGHGEAEGSCGCWRTAQAFPGVPGADISCLFRKGAPECWVLCPWITFLPDLTSL